MKPSKYLYPLSFVYLFVFNIVQRIKARSRKKLPCKVISVGNITAGGTGKTPTVIYLAKMLKSAGRKVCVVSRGYKRQSGNAAVGVVSDGRRIVMGKKLAGDEPYLIAQALKNVPVLVDKIRYRAGEYAVKNFAADIVILDDGFQHAGLRRDLDILCINALNPFGNGMLLPAGYLREPVKNISRAGIFIITRCDRVPEEKTAEIENTIKSRVKDAKIFHAFFSKKIFYRNEEVDAASFKDKNIIAVSGIALPEDFDITLKELGANILLHKKFPDHHFFKDNDIRGFLQSAAESQAAILTTSKDAGRMPEDFPCYIIDVRLEIKESAEFKKTVEAYLD